MPKQLLRRALNEEQRIASDAEMQAKELESAGKQLDEAVADKDSNVDLAATKLVAGLAGAFASYKMQMETYNANEILAKYSNQLNAEVLKIKRMPLKDMEKALKSGKLENIVSGMDAELGEFSPKLQLKARQALEGRAGKAMLDIQEAQLKKLDAAKKAKLEMIKSMAKAAEEAGQNPNAEDIVDKTDALGSEEERESAIKVAQEGIDAGKINKYTKDGNVTGLIQLREANKGNKALTEQASNAIPKAKDNAKSKVKDVFTDPGSIDKYLKLPADAVNSADKKTIDSVNDYLEIMGNVIITNGIDIDEVQRLKDFLGKQTDSDDKRDKAVEDTIKFVKDNVYKLYPTATGGQQLKDVPWEDRIVWGIPAADAATLHNTGNKLVDAIASNNFEAINGELKGVADKYGSDPKAVLRHAAKTLQANAKFNTPEYYRAKALEMYATNSSLFDKKDLTMVARFADRLPGLIPAGKVDVDNQSASFLVKHLDPDTARDLVQQVKIVTGAKMFSEAEGKMIGGTKDHEKLFLKKAKEAVADVAETLGKRFFGSVSKIPMGTTLGEWEDMSDDQKTNHMKHLEKATTVSGLENMVRDDFKSHLKKYEKFVLIKDDSGRYIVHGVKDGEREPIPGKNGQPIEFNSEISKTGASQTNPSDTVDFNKDNVRKTLENLNKGRDPGKLVTINQKEMDEQFNWISNRVPKKVIDKAKLFAEQSGISIEELGLGFLTIAQETNFIEKYAKKRTETTTLSKKEFSVKGYGNFEEDTNKEATKEWNKYFRDKVEFDPNNFGHVAVKIALFKKKRSLDYLSDIIKKNPKMLDVVNNMSYGHLARYQARIYNGTRSYKDEDTLVGVATDRGHSYNPIDPKYDGSRENAEYAFASMGALYSAKSMNSALGQQDRHEKGKRASVLLTRNVGTVTALAKNGMPYDVIMENFKIKVKDSMFHQDLMQRLRKDGINVQY